MTLEYLQQLAGTDIDKLIDTLDNNCLVSDLKACLNQYIPEKHDVTDQTKRPDKIIKKTSENGGAEIDAIVNVARLTLPFQKKIVLSAAAFLGTPDTQATTKDVKQENLLELVRKVLTDNKVDYKFKTIAKYTMSEKECAELWFAEITDPSYWEGYPIRSNKTKFRVKILSRSLGDTLYPVYDAYGDMIAFGRKYETKDVDETGEVTTTHLDLYTADRMYYFEKTSTSKWLVNLDLNVESLDYKGDGQPGAKNPFGKIPVIHYSQPYTEWHDVQCLIDRLEKKISNHADTNDYFDSPIVVAEGDVQGFSNKGEQGKVLEAKNGGKVSYLTWDMAPESMKLEIENLLKFIHEFTHTPNASFENMKGLGTFSGFAIKMLFMDAHLKASDKEEIFGEGVQRRINYIKSALAVLDPTLKPALRLDIKPVFKYFLPENIQEQVDVLVKAVEAKILSYKTAVELNPLVQNGEKELGLIKNEKTEATPTPPTA